jgi:arabinogalactan endo-1,4-beta-galactosidase
MKVLLDFDYEEYNPKTSKYEKAWLRLEITGDYSGEERQTYEYPGSSSCFEITKVKYEGIDITNVLEVLNIDYQHLEELCIEQIES